MEKQNHLKVLVVEDEPGMAGIISMLLKDKVSAHIDLAENCASTRGKLAESRYDLVTLDYQLPDGDGLELLEEIKSLDNAPPVVMVTGQGDESTAVQAFKLGAAGYVVKDPRMNVLLIEEVKSALARVEADRAGRALKESRDKYRQMFENMSSGAAVYGAVDDGEDFIILDFNKAGEAIDRIDRKEVIGRSALEVFPGIRDFGLFDVLQRVWRTGEPERFSDACYTDERISGWRRNNVYKLPSGEVVAIYEDLSERKNIEELLVNVVDGLPEAILIVNETGRIVYANKAMNALFEREVPGDSTLETLRGDFFKAYYAGTDEPYSQEKAPIHRALDGERSSINDIEIEAGGVRKHLEINAIPILGGDKKVKYAVALSRDITRQKKAESELVDREAKLRELYDSAVEGIGIVGSDGRFEYVNPRLVEMYGHDSVEEYIGKKAADSYVNQEDRERLLGILLEKGSVHGYEIRAKRMDGSSFWALANVTMYKDEKGNPLRTAGFLTDITSRKMAEEKLKRVNEELDAYAHTISHDLKGPLAAIGIAVNLLNPDLVDVKDGESEEILEIIRRNTGIAQRRVDNLLKLAESGQRPSEVEEVDVGEVVGEILQVISHQIEAKGVKVNADESMGRLKANRHQIEQLFSNLITNAIKHNNNSNPEVRIAYLGNSADGTHRYLVRDNGAGIPSAQLGGVFDPFKKGGKTGGAGLGLSIARKIVAVYGGVISAYNDNGACFEFELRDYLT